jgi:hypothetical protein
MTPEEDFKRAIHANNWKDAANVRAVVNFLWEATHKIEYPEGVPTEFRLAMANLALAHGISVAILMDYAKTLPGGAKLPEEPGDWPKPEAGKWQPIETMPEAEACLVALAATGYEGTAFIVGRKIDGKVLLDWNHDDPAKVAWKVTHWQALPAPPK